MNARITIEVADRKQARAIEAGLRDPEVRAIAIVAGMLNPLTPLARERVLRHVVDFWDDPDNRPKAPSPEAARPDA